MSEKPTPLAAEIACLRTAVTAPGDRGLLPKSLRNLIIAILTRLFTRLEQAILLWQSGNLPIPPARAPRTGRAPQPHQSAAPARPRGTASPAAARANPRAPHPGTAHQGAPHHRPLHQRPLQEGTPPGRIAHAPLAPSGRTAPRAITIPPPPHPARAPPPIRFRSPWPQLHSHVLNVSYS